LNNPILTFALDLGAEGGPRASLVPTGHIPLADHVLARTELSYHAANLYQRLKGMTPSMDPVLAALCLAGWKVRHQPDVTDVVHGQWYAAIVTQNVGLNSVGTPLLGGHHSSLSPMYEWPGATFRGKAKIDVDTTLLPGAGFFAPLIRMKPEKCTEIIELACLCILAGWNAGM
jgi:hypothetical protein